MAYTLDNRPAEIDAPPLLQTSAMSWQQLTAPYRAGRGTFLKMGGKTLIVPAFSRVRFMGQDDSGVVTDLSSVLEGSQDPSGLDLEQTPLDLANMPLQDQGGSTSMLLPGTQPGSIAVPGGEVNLNPTLIPITAASIAQQAANVATGITSAVNAVPAAPQVATVPTSSILPGVSNTAVLIGGLVVLMVLASGKKR